MVVTRVGGVDRPRGGEFEVGSVKLMVLGRNLCIVYQYVLYVEGAGGPSGVSGDRCWLMTRAELLEASKSFNACRRSLNRLVVKYR